MSTNTWYHVVMVFDGSGSANTDRMKVYVNGNPEAISYTYNIPTLTTNRNTELRIGGIYNSASVHGFHGKIDDVGVWDRALTATEVTTLYQSPNTSATSLEIEEQVQLYPNPTSDKVHVLIDTERSTAYTLYASDGKAVEVGIFEEGTGSVDLSARNKGVYLLRIRTNEGILTKKIIKH